MRDFVFMRRHCVLLLVLAAAVVSAQTIKIKSEISDAVLKCGQPGKFIVTVLDKDGKKVTSGKVECRFQDDHYNTLSTQTVELADGNPFTVARTLDKPGLLRCDVNFEKSKDFAVIAFDPFKITAEQVCPADFKEFWMKSKAEALKMPLDVKLKKLDRLSNEHYTGYAIDFANINGTRMHGFLSVPTAPGPHPAGVMIPGMGVGFLGIPDSYQKDKTIVLAINVHPYPNEPATARKKLQELNKEQHYYFHGLPVLKEYIFHRVLIGICRGIRYIQERPEWDKKHLAVTGTSQGGGLTIATTALNAEVVTAAAVNVPAFCELLPGPRPQNNRWVKIFMTPGGSKITPYFDGVNFAPMIRCPMIWSAGFKDTTCYPRTILAAYNRLECDKFIWLGTEMTHSSSPAYREFCKRWLAQQLAK